MKHYKIISIVKLVGIQRHLYTIHRIGGSETGNYTCASLNDTKIESDFCCEPTSHIDSIKCMDTNRVFEMRQNTNLGIIEGIRLNKGRGELRIGNNWHRIDQVQLPAPVPILQPIVNNTTMAKTAAAPKISPSAPSRSQAAKQDLFEELETKILKTKELRLEKFLKKNLPPTLKEFLINFFTTYNNERKTIWVESKITQTTEGRRRSLGDIFHICRYYYPECTLKEVVTLLFKGLQTHFKTGFRCSYCSTINKRVWYYNAGSNNLMEDEREDEYKNRVEWYKSKI